MHRPVFCKAGTLVLLCVWIALVGAPLAQGGTLPVGGFGGTVLTCPPDCPGGGIIGGGGGFVGGSGGSVNTSVPEPSSLLLVVVGLAAAGWGAWRNRR